MSETAVRFTRLARTDGGKMDFLLALEYFFYYFNRLDIFYGGCSSVG